MRFLAFLFWAALPLCVGCQADPNGGKTNGAAASEWQFRSKRHYIRYVASKKELQAEASFDMAQKDAARPSKYWLNETAMQVKNIPQVGTMFRLVQEPVAFTPPYTLRHLAADGQTPIVDTLDLPQLANLRIGSGNLSLSKGGVLAWDGDIALAATDELRIIITDSDGKTTTISHIGDTPKGTLPLPLEQIAALPKGNATVSISLSRSDVKPATKTHRRIEYYFPDISTSIIP